MQERIDIPRDAPKEQQRKITAYNELLEDIYQRKMELETLECHLAAMKLEIEGDIEHLTRKTVEEAALKAHKRTSGATAVVAFVRSSSPVQASGTGKEGESAPKTSANPNAVANGIAAALANLKSVAGTTRNAKSRGKGKGRQEKAKLNGTDLKYQKGGKISLDVDYEYSEVEGEADDSEEYENEEYYGEEDGKTWFAAATSN